ncbi:hypothetical protein, partial [Microcystis aeruginosa]|uniref:hypothetical protein n=1 Tax=Microcystis aeruginosa TaxID=1126 RepID=UPI002FEE5F56
IGSIDLCVLCVFVVRSTPSLGEMYLRIHFTHQSWESPLSLSPTKPKRSTSQNNRQNLPISQPKLFYLERELLTLVNGDKALATRLLLNIRLRNPQRSKSWCYEKVIYDLKRDRGGI